MASWMSERCIATDNSCGKGPTVWDPRIAEVLAGRDDSAPAPTDKLDATMRALATWSNDPPQVATFRADERAHLVLVEKLKTAREQLAADEQAFVAQQQKRADALAQVRDSITGGTK